MEIFNNFYRNIFLFLSLFILNNQENLPFRYPVSLTLLDQSIALVGSDGIHFYDKELTIDSNNISFTVQYEDIDKIALAQFSESDGGYILILVKNFIYIFAFKKK